ncbi:MAG: hypothetical protein IMZ60_05250 [Actinobacteria bacterium]|nr:hypothetical protein [Actinomycetota bacterium]
MNLKKLFVRTFTSCKYKKGICPKFIIPIKKLNRKPVIKESAASVIFIHNHPSGDPEPSSDDIEITNRLCKSCSILGISVPDHIIVAEGGYFSFKQKQLI